MVISGCFYTGGCPLKKTGAVIVPVGSARLMPGGPDRNNDCAGLERWLSRVHFEPRPYCGSEVVLIRADFNEHWRSGFPRPKVASATPPTIPAHIKPVSVLGWTTGGVSVLDMSVFRAEPAELAESAESARGGGGGGGGGGHEHWLRPNKAIFQGTIWAWLELAQSGSWAGLGDECWQMLMNLILYQCSWGLCQCSWGLCHCSWDFVIVPGDYMSVFLGAMSVFLGNHTHIIYLCNEHWLRPNKAVFQVLIRAEVHECWHVSVHGHHGSVHYNIIWIIYNAMNTDSAPQVRPDTHP